MNDIRRMLVFSKGERIAIIAIMVVVIALIAVCLFPISSNRSDTLAFHRLDSIIQARQLALNQQRQKPSSYQSASSYSENQLHPFEFNPNNMTEDDWRKLGLSDRQIRGIMNYQSKGGRFYSKKDFSKLYTISEEEYEILEPYIVIPDLSQNGYSRSKPDSYKSNGSKENAYNADKKTIPVVDINTADSLLFVELPQIGPYVASRILRYRDRLGGFISKEQLREVKGVDSTHFDKISPFLTINDSKISKIDVNRDDFKTLLRHPYLNYDMVKVIVNYRESRGMIKDWEQFLAIFRDKKVVVNQNLKYYVKY